MTRTDAGGTSPTPPSPAAAAPAAVAQRLERLESENSRLRRIVVATLLVTSILLGLATALVVVAARHGMPGFVPDLVEAREFVLRDGSGRVRGVWGSDDQGAIRLVLQDHQTLANVKLNLLDDRSTGLTFADSAGNPRLVLAVLPDETTSLVFADGRGLTRTVLTLNPSGASTLVFGDPGGTTRSAIGVDSRGRAVLSAQGLLDNPIEPEPEDTAPAPARRRR